MTDRDEWDEHTRRASRTYASAVDHYLRPALGFWDRFGAETVARVRPGVGGRVLDLCCGAGASAIPAAHAVGPTGRVLGVDVAAPLLALARARAARLGLGNVEFRCADATRIDLPDASFDAVLCVFGIFFAADMTGFAARLWRLVRPGGTLAVTTWGAGLFEPATSVFWAEVAQLDPALVRAFNPWDELTSATAVVELFAQAGIADATAQEVAATHRLDGPAQFWDIVLGSGYRATVDALPAAQADTLRERVIARLHAQNVTRLRTDVIFGAATRHLSDS